MLYYKQQKFNPNALIWSWFEDFTKINWGFRGLTIFLEHGLPYVDLLNKYYRASYTSLLHLIGLSFKAGIWLLQGALVRLHRRFPGGSTVEMQGVSTGVAPGRSQNFCF